MPAVFSGLPRDFSSVERSSESLFCIPLPELTLTEMPRFADYMRLVKFQHTIFRHALRAHGLCLCHVEICAGGGLSGTAVVVRAAGAGGAVHGLRTQYGHGIQPLGRPAHRCRESPHGRSGDSRRRDLARRALTFVAVNALLFVACAATINRLTALLSPVALAVIMGYSYCKRFTWAAHLVLGLSLSIAPVGALSP